ncbi:MAG TPA: right-handed parallel beta-helix repeat-containing protein [Anaerolineaceae bacterium]|nr:right-handed parallel beta-helix repeat-containing protein [Anaerolineaceae bacterium]
MNRSSHCGKLIALVVLVSLVFAALTPTAAFAEGDIPEAPPAEVPPAAEEPEEDVPAAVQLLAEAGAVIVQDGAALPLASQGALDGLCDPDPWYYGAGTGPNCLGGVCTYTWADGGADSLKYALNDWGVNKGYGFIYIEQGLGDYVLNKSIDATDNGFATLKGLVVAPGSATPSISGKMSFTNFTAGFTIQGLYIHDSNETILRFVHNKGTIKIIDTELSGSETEGLLIEDHKGAVELNRVSVHDNAGRGIDIDNCNFGVAACASIGTVKITNSTVFTNGTGNKSGGIQIVSGGAITLDGVTAFSNTGNGIKVDSYGSLIIKNSAVSNNRENVDPSPSNRGFGILIADESRGNILLENVYVQGNGKSGLWLYTNTGSITLKKVQVIGNGLDTNNAERRYGVEIGDHTLPLAEQAGALNVTITDSVFLDNYNTNLQVHARGAVTLTNIMANNSTAKQGVYIKNDYAAYAAPVMVVNSIFNENADSGLSVISKGAITLNSINLVKNNKATPGTGLTLSNTSGTAGVTILSTYGTNVVQNDPAAGNTRVGATISSKGNVLINNLEVYNHTSSGILVSTSGGITWKGGGAWNNTSKLGSGNAELGGAKLVVLNNNVKPVIVMNARFDNNTNGVGLYIFTQGPVTLSNVDANYNGYDGVRSFNASSVSILRTLPSGNNTFNNNGLVYPGGHGLYLMVDTNVVLNRVEAKGNTGAGAMIQSDMGGSVTITGTATLPADFSGNMGYHQGGAVKGIHAGLEISAYGIKLTNIRANINNGAGVYLRSWGSSISILGTLNEFSGNSINTTVTAQKYGLWIDQAYGPVTLLNFKAEENYGGGIYIDNTAGTGSVTLNSTVAGFTSSVTNGDGTYGGYGLSIKSRGAVTLTKVDISDGNQIAPGAYINNSSALTSMPVKVSLSSFNNNDGYGLEVVSAGSITVSKVTANGNKVHGVYLYNNLPLLPGQVYMPITILNSTFNKNGDSGAEIFSNRTITISSITASGNFGNGVYLENIDDFASSVLVSGKNQFIGNGNNGLEVSGYGLVTISGVESGRNYADGIYISTEKQVTISNSWLYQNWNGIFVENAPVTINNVTSMGNGYYGLDLEGVDLGGKVKLTNSTFILNADAGINIDFDSDDENDLIMFNVNYFGNNAGGENIIIN